MRLLFCFFFNPPATPSFSTLSLHDALPIWLYLFSGVLGGVVQALLGLIAPHFAGPMVGASAGICGDRKSTRLNSSHITISYAVFCLKKKKKSYYNERQITRPRSPPAAPTSN